MREMVESDDYFQVIKTKLSEGKLDPGQYQLRSGLVYYKGRILINPTSSLTQTLIAEHHDTPSEGHSGYDKTLQKLKKAVHWRGLKNSVKHYIRSCDTCQRSKHENLNPAGLLQPLPIPEQAWEEITMDFIACLPKSFGISAIFVIVDRLTKYAQFVALSHPYTSKTIVGVFIANVFKYYGLPKVIIPDRDNLFLRATILARVFVSYKSPD